MDPFRFTPPDDALPAHLNRLADAGLAAAGDGLLREVNFHPDAPPEPEFLYTETHFALLLVLLHQAGARPDGLREAAARLRAWDRLQVAPTFFNSMAVALIALVRRDGPQPAHAELDGVLASILGRRRDFAEGAWKRSCGNNMYLQQLVTDLLLAPLADGRPVAADAADRLADAFRSCTVAEGFFFDLPRPGCAEDRQYPFTYNLKMLFLLALACRYLPHPRLKEQFRMSACATLSVYTSEGDSSYFGRTDRSTFAAGLAAGCLRATVVHGLGGDQARGLISKVEELFLSFPFAADGCLEVNRYPVDSTDRDRMLSRDDYAYRWQYAIAGSAYLMLSRAVFPAGDSAAVAAEPEQGVFSSRELGLVRVRDGALDLFVRTAASPAGRDIRHAGPGILRLEWRGKLIIGTLPIRLASDSFVAVPRDGRSALARRLALSAYSWRHGVEYLKWSLAGYVPVLFQGHRGWMPAPADRQDLESVPGAGSLVKEHSFRAFHAGGFVPAWNLSAQLVAPRVPALLKPLFAQRPFLLGEDGGIRLNRTIQWSASAVRLTDRITGDLSGKRIAIGTRLFGACPAAVSGLAPGEAVQGWSSDGPVTVQLHGADCSGGVCEYSITLPFGTARGPDRT